MLDGKAFLVIESQFLIAIDIQRILEGAGTGTTVFARSVSEVELLDDLSDFDVLIIEINSSSSIKALQFLLKARQAGLSVVVTSTDSHILGTIPQLAGTLIVLKPFGDRALIEACQAACRG